jgi:hypothetical protein
MAPFPGYWLCQRSSEYPFYSETCHEYLYTGSLQGGVIASVQDVKNLGPLVDEPGTLVYP